MTDAELRAKIRRDAVANGCNPEFAETLARLVVDGPVAPTQARGAAQARARARSRPPTNRAERVHALCSMFGANAMPLARELDASRLPLKRIASLLTAATGNARTLGAAAAQSIRVDLARRAL